LVLAQSDALRKLCRYRFTVGGNMADLPLGKPVTYAKTQNKK
jgi:hypothetical protein